MEVFSTITSPIFSELVIVLSAQEVPDLSYDATLFQMLSKMYEVRPFELVFLFEGPCYALRGELADLRLYLKEAVDDVISKGFLDFLDSPPTSRTSPQSYYSRWPWRPTNFD